MKTDTSSMERRSRDNLEQQLRSRLAMLSLAQKVRLLSGRDH